MQQTSRTARAAWPAAFALLLGFALVAPAAASSDDSWDEMFAKARQSCIDASGFSNAEASKPVVFSDDVGYVALLVAGTFPQKHMNGQKGDMLCLFDRSTGTAKVEEAAGWRW